MLHPKDARERPHLYKVNKVTPEQLLENLTVLIEKPENDANVHQEVSFPCADQMMSILKEETESTTSKGNTSWKFKQPLAVIWDQPDGCRE